KPGELRLKGPTLAQILLGTITRWNDEAIRSLNPGMSLPDLPITPVHRSDGSGSTFLFTSYLSAVSPEWRQRIGSGSSVRWPLGQSGKGNGGVATVVHGLPGAVGYVEYTYAVENEVPFTQLQNKAGRWVSPGEASFREAAAEAQWARPNFYEILIDRA